jgi:hypothetical protein
VQEVFSGMRHTGVYLLDLGFRLFPVIAVFNLAAPTPLIVRQAFLMLLETIERRNEAAIAERGKVGNADVDANTGSGYRDRRFDFSFGLNRHQPFSAVRGDGDVLGRAKHVPALSSANPAQLREFDSTVRLIDGALLPVRKSKAIGRSAFFLKNWVGGPFLKAVLVTAPQIGHDLLQRWSRSILKEGKFFFASRKPIIHPKNIREFLTRRLIFFAGDPMPNSRPCAHSRRIDASHGAVPRSVLFENGWLANVS